MLRNGTALRHHRHHHPLLTTTPCAGTMSAWRVETVVLGQTVVVDGGSSPWRSCGAESIFAAGANWSGAGGRTLAYALGNPLMRTRQVATGRWHVGTKQGGVGTGWLRAYGKTHVRCRLLAPRLWCQTPRHVVRAFHVGRARGAGALRLGVGPWRRAPGTEAGDGRS